MARYGRARPQGHALLIRVTPAAALVAGTVVFSSSSPTTIVMTESVAASGGVGGITRQWQRNDNGGAYSNLSGQTGATCTDSASLVVGHLYGYRVVYTDSGSNTATSNAVTAQLYTGGAIGTGSLPAQIGSPMIRRGRS